MPPKSFCSDPEARGDGPCRRLPDRMRPTTGFVFRWYCAPNPLASLDLVSYGLSLCRNHVAFPAAERLLLPRSGQNIIPKAMTAKRKRRRRRSASHIARRLRGVVQTPLRLAFDATREPRLRSDWSIEVPSTSEQGARLVHGYASADIVRAWLNGRRRAPAWFVAVLDSELARQISKRQAIREQLARYETGDRRKGPIASARARAQRLRQLGRLPPE